MARKPRSDKGRPRGRVPSMSPPKVTTELNGNAEKSAPEKNEKDRGFYFGSGAKVGYRDGPDGTIEVASFDEEWIPVGWHALPTDCKNCPGYHIDYVKVDPNDPS